MLVDLATKADFRADILSNRIEEKMLDSFQGALGKSVGKNDLASWQSFLPYMDQLLAYSSRVSSMDSDAA